MDISGVLMRPDTSSPLRYMCCAPVLAVAEADIQLRQQPEHVLLGAQRQSRPCGGEAHGAVYRAGVHIDEAEARGGGPCNGALARARGPVYCDGKVLIHPHTPDAENLRRQTP